MPPATRPPRTPPQIMIGSEDGCGKYVVGRVGGTLSDGFRIAALFFGGLDTIAVSVFCLFSLVDSLSGEVMFFC